MPKKNNPVNPVREPRSLTPSRNLFLTGLTDCADPIKHSLSNKADGGIKPLSDLSGNDHRFTPLEVNRQRRLSHLWCGLLTGLKSVAFSNGVNNQSLLNEIEKMLSAPQGRDYLKNNALLGFCAQLIATRPEARDNYRQYLKQRLVALYPRKRKIDWKQKMAVLRLLPLRQLFTHAPRWVRGFAPRNPVERVTRPQRLAGLHGGRATGATLGYLKWRSISPWSFTLRTASLCLSLILLIVLGIINGQNSWHQRTSGVSLSPRIIDNATLSETDRITPREKTLSLTSEKMNYERNYRVLKEYQEFKLIEYTLFDGSKIIAVENILL